MIKVKKGDRIELEFMPPHDPNPIPVGTQGVVEAVVHPSPPINETQIFVKWDSGRSLNLIVPSDRYRIVKSAPTAISE